MHSTKEMVIKILLHSFLLCGVAFLITMTTHNNLVTGRVHGVNMRFKIAQRKWLNSEFLYLLSINNASSAISCGVLCASYAYCLSFFYAKSYIMAGDLSSDPGTPEPFGGTLGPGDELFNCLLMQERRNASVMPVGDGVYGIFEKYLEVSITEEGGGDEEGSGDENSGLLPPSIPNARHQYTTRSQLGLVAIYNCSGPKFETFGWLYDPHRGIWPSFSPDQEDCASSICSTFPLAGTSLLLLPSTATTIGNNSDVVAQMRLICDFQELSYCDLLTCDSEDWTFHDQMFPNTTCTTSCLSSTCYRVDIDLKASYNGQINTNSKGLPCRRWDDPYLDDYVFDEDVPAYDGQVRSHMVDYCRDVNNWSIPSCYSLLSLEPCDVPLCQYHP